MLLFALLACGSAPVAPPSTTFSRLESGDGDVFVDVTDGTTHAWYRRPQAAAPGDPFTAVSAPPSTLRLVATPGRWLALTTGDEVFVSADRGVTWAPLPALPRLWTRTGWPAAMEYVDLDVAPDGRVYATGREAVVRLEDGAWNVVLKRPASMVPDPYGESLVALDFDPSGTALLTSYPFGVWTWTPDGAAQPAADGVLRPGERLTAYTDVAHTSDDATWLLIQLELHRRGPSDAAFQHVPFPNDPLPPVGVAPLGPDVVLAAGSRVARVAPDGTATDLHVAQPGDPWPLDVVTAGDRVYVGLGGTTPSQRALEIGSDGTVTPIALP
jgi:hypothetical protein